MKEALNSLYFLSNFVPFYILFFCYLLQEFSYVFLLQYMRKKSKRWLVIFKTFIDVTLEHIHILIAPARKSMARDNRPFYRYRRHFENIIY